MSLSTNLKTIKPTDSFAFVINLTLLSASVGLIILHSKSFPLQVPFWYSKQWGVERLASSQSFWLIPILIFAFFVLNNTLAKVVGKNNFVISKILVWSSSFTALILAFSLYRIILVVI